MSAREKLITYLMRFAGYSKFENNDFDNKTFGQIADEIIAMVGSDSARKAEDLKRLLRRAGYECTPPLNEEDHDEIACLEKQIDQSLQDVAELKQRLEVSEVAISLNASLAEEVERVHTANSGLLAERNTWARQLADAKDAVLNAEQEVEKARTYAAGVSNDRDELTVAIGELVHRTEEAGFDTIPVDILKREIARWERSGIPEVEDE